MKRITKFCLALLLALGFTLLVSASARPAGGGDDVGTITISNAKVVTKTFDGTDEATIDFEKTGIDPDFNKVEVKYTAYFDDEYAGTDKNVHVRYYLEGDDASHYALLTDGQTDLKGTIAKKEVTVVNSSVANLEYCGKDYVRATIRAELQGTVEFYEPLLIKSGNFPYPAKVGANQEIKVTYTLTGDDAENYILTNPTETLKGEITKRLLTATRGTLASKTYDGTTTATFTDVVKVGIRSNDDAWIQIDANFTSKNVGTWGVTLTYDVAGTDSGNYNPFILDWNFKDQTASITPATVTVEDIVVEDKEYDGTTNATVTFTTKGIVAGEDVKVVATANFADKNVGEGKTVYVTFALQGAEADLANYTLGTTSYEATGTITPKTVSVTTAPQIQISKAYDGTTAATVKKYSLSGALAGDDVKIDTVTAEFENKDAGTDKDVSVTCTLTGADAGNYTVKAATVKGKITQRMVPIAAIELNNKAYDGTAVCGVESFTITTSAAYELTRQLMKTENVQVNVNAAFADKNAGENKTVTATVTCSSGNYNVYIMASVSKTLKATISPVQLTVSGTTADGKTYDGTVDAVAHIGNMTGAVAGDDVKAEIETAVFDNAGAGNGKKVVVTYKLSGVDAGNYTVEDSVTSADIERRTVTASTPKVYSQTYDKTPIVKKIDVPTLSGVLAGDDVTVAEVKATFQDGSAGVNKVVYAMYTLGGKAAPNYCLANNGAAELTGTIEPAVLTVKPGKVSSKYYDGTTTAVVEGSSLEGVLSGDNVSLTCEAEFDNKNAGENKQVTVNYTLEGENAGNYTLSKTQDSLTGNIYKKMIPITAVIVADKNYDGTTAATVTDFTIDQADYYADVRKLVEDENVQITWNASFESKDVGLHKVKVAATPSDAVNYVVDFGMGVEKSIQATIAPAMLTVKGTTADGKTYDGTVDAVAHIGNMTGAVAGDDVKAEIEKAVFDDADAGNGKQVSVTYKLSGVDAGNYTVEDSVTSADITPKTVTASTPKVYSQTYDKTPIVKKIDVPTLSGVLAGDDVTVAEVKATFQDGSAGVNKVVYAMYTLGGKAAPNYCLANNGAAELTGTIEPIVLTVKQGEVRYKYYDGTTTAVVNGSSLEGVLDGDNVSLICKAEFDNKNAGENKQVTVNYTLEGTEAANYTLSKTQDSLTGCIYQRSIPIAAITVADKTYDGTTAAAVTDFTIDQKEPFAKVRELVETENVQLIWNASFESKDAGTRKVTVTVTPSDTVNYYAVISNSIKDSIEATITPAPLTVTGLAAENKTYDGTADATVTYSGVDGIIGSEDVSVELTAVFANADVGDDKEVTVSYDLSGTGAGNYACPEAETLTADIEPAPLTVKGTVAADKVYDGNNRATFTRAGKLVGLMEGDKVTLRATGSFRDELAGENKPVFVRYKISGAKAANYVLVTDKATVYADITADEEVLAAAVYTTDEGRTLKLTVIGSEAEAIVVDENEESADPMNVTVALPEDLMGQGVKTLRIRLSENLYLELDLEKLRPEDEQWILTVDRNEENTGFAVNRMGAELVVIEFAEIPENAVKLTFDGAEVRYFDEEDEEITKD